jgi:hypothetical protein
MALWKLSSPVEEDGGYTFPSTAECSQGKSSKPLHRVMYHESLTVLGGSSCLLARRDAEGVSRRTIERELRNQVA